MKIIITVFSSIAMQDKKITFVKSHETFHLSYIIKFITNLIYYSIINKKIFYLFYYFYKKFKIFSQFGIISVTYKLTSNKKIFHIVFLILYIIILIVYKYASLFKTGII